MLRQTVDAWGILPLKPEPRTPFAKAGTEEKCFEHGVFIMEVRLTRYYNTDPDGRKTMLENYAGGRMNVRAYTPGHVYLAQVEVPLVPEIPSPDCDLILDHVLPKVVDKAQDRLWDKLAGEEPTVGGVITSSLVINARK